MDCMAIIGIYQVIDKGAAVFIEMIISENADCDVIYINNNNFWSCCPSLTYFINLFSP